MSEEPTNAAGAGRDEPLAGRRLAAARRARNISLQDVANELHLDAPKVTALEQNRFHELGGAVFVKGYLRKYAEVVGLSADAVLADYRRCDTGDEEPPIVGLRRPPREFPAGPLLTGLLAVAVVAGGLWAWRSGAFQGLMPGARTAASAPAAGAPAAVTETAETALPDAGEGAAGAAAEMPGSNGSDVSTPFAAPPEAAPAESGTAEAVTESQEPVLAAPESVPPPEGQVNLQVTFTGDCWTEVSDAAGDRLYFGMGRAGETVSVTGIAPLHVLLGHSDHASLTVDGQGYAIPPAARRGETARLTIAGADAGGDAP